MTVAIDRSLLPVHGIRLWLAVAGGIVLWIAHLGTVAALAPSTCAHPDVAWVIHGTTAVAALATIAAAVRCAAFRPRATDPADAEVMSGHHDPPEDEGSSVDARMLFLARFGILSNLSSLVLILAEGLMLPALPACR